MARQGLCECTSRFFSFLKWVVILINVLLWLLGIAILAVGVWLYIAANEYSALSEGRYLVGSVLLITSGFAVIIVGFLGFVGAVFESSIVLIIYAVLIAITSTLQLAAGGWAVHQLNFLLNDSRSDITGNMQFYTGFEDIRRAYDHLHMTFECCGDVMATEWADDVTGTAPDSCCITPITGCGRNTTGFYTTGCTNDLATYRQNQLNIIGPLGLAAGIFGIITGVFAPILLVFTGAVLGNSFSSLIILLSEPQNVDIGKTLNFSNTTSNMCQLESTTHSVSDRTYYLLIAVAAISSLSANIASFGVLSVPGRTYKCMPLIKVWSQTKLSLLHIVKALFSCKYALLFVFCFYCGMDLTYFFSIFNKYFVSDCIGVGYVGVITALRSLLLVLASILTGKIVAYTSRTALNIVTMVFAMILLFVMLFWEREPSYVVIFLLAIGLGAVNGSASSISAAYLGVVGQKEAEVVFSVFWAARAFGGAAMFFLSGSISVSVGVIILLIVVAFVYLCYFCAEYFYGELKSITSTASNGQSRSEVNINTFIVIM